MKKLRTIGSSLLALLVLLASSHFFVDVHFCGDQLKAISFLSEADGCGHAQMPPCHRDLMNGCCENQQITHDAQDLKKEAVAIQISPTVDAAIVHHAWVLAEIIPQAVQRKTHLLSYKPPLPNSDRHAVLSVFVI
jgi:hypothetical protein